MKVLLSCAALLFVFNLSLNARWGAVDALPDAQLDIPIPVPSPAFPPSASLPDICYKGGDGCFSVSNIYVRYALKLKYGGNCDKFRARAPKPPLFTPVGLMEGEGCEAVKALGSRKTFTPSERKKLCIAVHDALWERANFAPSWIAGLAGGAAAGAASPLAFLSGPSAVKALIDESEVHCESSGSEASWFDTSLEIDGDGGAGMLSNEDKAQVAFVRCPGGGAAAKYYGVSHGIFKLSFRLKCRKEDGVWRAKNISIRVDKPVMYAPSSGLTAAAGSSLGGAGDYAGLAELEDAGRSFPFSEWLPPISVNGFCGSQGDQSEGEAEAADCVDEP